MNNNEIEKFPLDSMDIKQEQISRLKQLFPEVFTEGNILDWEKLKLTLGEDIDVRKERFGLNWAEKSDCFKLIQQPSTGTLVPAKEESINFDTTENLFIEGDNLEVLKLLQKSYFGKVKMIYIDPPYNTGNDFVYTDDFKDNLKNYLELTGQVDAGGKKLSTNVESGGRFHSNWLNMMYPRLFLAKNLLTEDGVIFISIDDNEIHNLRALCNEIFGEENFLSQIIIQSNKRGQTYKEIAKTHEYLIVFTKTDVYEIYEFEKGESDLPFEDTIGRFDLWELRNRNPKFGRFNRPNLYFPIFVSREITDQSGYSKISLTKNDDFDIEIYPLDSNGNESCWRWGREKLLRSDLSSGTAVVVAKEKRDGGWNIYEKSRKNTTKAKSIWLDTSIISEQGTIGLGMLELGKFFDHPKPIELIKRTLKIGVSKEDTILDFFAGSCTTAHAVLELNREDGGNRKFICVQIPEPTDETSEAFKAGYKNIAEIGKERIRRVIKKIETEKEKQEPDMFEGDKKPQDLGFKVFKLQSSNFATWDANVEKSIDALTEKLFQHIDHISPEAEQDAILYELLLKAGFELTTQIQKLTVADKTVYSVMDNALLICLERNLTHELLKAIAELKPVRFICLDEGFLDNDQLKSNAVLLMKENGVQKFQTV